ncbi:MAG: hypothetical protein AB9842_02610 [Bacteroidales bacterium]
MKGEDNIDKLFKERLQQDHTVFKEDYWQGFEKMLNTVPPVPPAVPSSGITGLGKIFSSLTFTKGILAGISTAVLTAAVFFVVNNVSDEKSTTNPERSKTEVIVKNPTQESPASQKQAPDNSADNQAPKSKSTAQLDDFSIQAGIQPGFNKKIKTVAAAREQIPKDNIIGSQEVGVAEQAVHQAPATDAIKVIETGSTANQGTDESVKYEVVADKLTDVNSGALAVTGLDTATSKEAIYADSVFHALESTVDGYRKAGNSSRNQHFKDSKLKVFIVPGMALFNTFGNPEDFSSVMKPAFEFGAGLSYNFNKSFSLSTEVNFLMVTGFKLTESSLNSEYLFYQWINKVSIENRNFTLMNIPIMARYQLNRHTFGAGPVFRYVIASGGEKVVMDTTPLLLSYHNSAAENYLSGINRFQAGVSLEYSFNFYRQNAILVRYNLMTGDFTRSSYYEGFNSGRLNLLLIAFRFRIF